MKTIEVRVQRFSVTSPKPFADVLASIGAAVGHPDIGPFQRELAGARTFEEVERVVDGAVSPFGLMEFFRLDLGDVVRKARGGEGPQIVRLIVGNPVTMSRMARHVPDAAAYAPVTILIDERPDGVHVSYDRMASLLAPYGSAEALAVARELDTKVESILKAAA